jgi:hypothetical protein
VVALAVAAILGGSAALVSLTAGAAPAPGGTPHLETPVSEPMTSSDAATEIEAALAGSQDAPDPQASTETEQASTETEQASTETEQASTETEQASTDTEQPDAGATPTPEVDHHDGSD